MIRHEKGWPDSLEGILLWTDGVQTALEATTTLKVPGKEAPKRVQSYYQPQEGGSSALVTKDRPQPEPLQQTRQSDTEHPDQNLELAETTQQWNPEDQENTDYLQDATDATLITASQQKAGLPPCDWYPKECSTLHLLKNCKQFIGKTPVERTAHLRTIKRCFNCFRLDHLSPECKSVARCGKCGSKHNTLIHEAFLNIKRLNW
jgi:hypothetical protein